jgi:hypothetical protein
MGWVVVDLWQTSGIIGPSIRFVRGSRFSAPCVRLRRPGASSCGKRGLGEATQFFFFQRQSGSLLGFSDMGDMWFLHCSAIYMQLCGFDITLRSRGEGATP